MYDDVLALWMERRHLVREDMYVSPLGPATPLQTRQNRIGIDILTRYKPATKSLRTRYMLRLKGRKR